MNVTEDLHALHRRYRELLHGNRGILDADKQLREELVTSVAELLAGKEKDPHKESPAKLAALLSANTSRKPAAHID